MTHEYSKPTSICLEVKKNVQNPVDIYVSESEEINHIIISIYLEKTYPYLIEEFVNASLT